MFSSAIRPNATRAALSAVTATAANAGGGVRATTESPVTSPVSAFNDTRAPSAGPLKGIPANWRSQYTIYVWLDAMAGEAN